MNAKNLDNAEKILANLESVTGALAVQRESLEGGVEDLAELLDNGGQASAQLPALMTRLDQTAEAVRTMAEDILADFRLDLELLDLLQDFTTEPASVELKLRAQLFDMARQRVLATRTFAYQASVTRNETAAAVEEMNNLIAVFLPELAQFCVDSSQSGSNRSD